MRQLYVVGWLQAAGWHVVARRLYIVGRRVVDWWLHMAWRRAMAKQLYVAGRCVMGGRLHMARRLFVT